MQQQQQLAVTGRCVYIGAIVVVRIHASYTVSDGPIRECEGARVFV